VSDRKETEALRRTIVAFLQGDTDQYRSIKNRITQYLYRHDYGGRLDRDEVVDEVLLILFDNLSHNRFHGDSLKALNVYIYGIVRNHIRSALSRRRRLSYTADEFDSPDPNAEDPARHAERRDLIRKLFAAVTEACAEVLTLKFRKGWSDQEIAEHQQKTKNAVSTAISRCLDRLRSLDFVRELL